MGKWQNGDGEEIFLYVFIVLMASILIYGFVEFVL